LHGAFDDVYIIISKEKWHAFYHYCHKTKEYTMAMQAIFNHEKRFVDICIGQLGPLMTFVTYARLKFIIKHLKKDFCSTTQQHAILDPSIFNGKYPFIFIAHGSLQGVCARTCNLEEI